MFEKPSINLDSSVNKRVIKLFFSDKEYKVRIISEISKLFSSMTTFSAANINREISHFIYRKFENDKKVSNVNFYNLLKILISGDTKISLLGDVCELIGQKTCVNRIKIGGSMIKGGSVKKEIEMKNEEEQLGIE